jgi:CHAT domain-containing protein/predicted negative regulator of RcsB-dependent stress response
LVVTGLPGCHSSRKPELAELFSSIHGDFVRGDLDVAQARAHDAGQVAASTGKPDDKIWVMRFRLLEAEAAFHHDRPADTLALLTTIPFPDDGDLAIKRDLLCSRAHESLGDKAEAARELSSAKTLAKASGSTLLGDALHDEALALTDSEQFAEAEDELNASLAMARSSSDAWLEAGVLGDIGYLLLQTGHYDQAAIASRVAINFERSIHARVLLQLALGNEGWAYANLGDFASALADFQEAEQLAFALGLNDARLYWLGDAGQAAFLNGDAERAETFDKAALQVARLLTPASASDEDEIANIEINLSSLLYEQGRYDDAAHYIDEAANTARASKDPNVSAYALYMRGRMLSRQPGNHEAEALMMQALKATTDDYFRSGIENQIATLYKARHDVQRARHWYRSSIDTFEQKRSSVQDEALRLSAFGYGDSVYQTYAHFLIDGGKQSQALELLDASRARTLEEGLGLAKEETGKGKDRQLDVEQVARNLNGVILFYALGNERSYLWAIDGTQTRLFALPRQQDIRALVEQYQRAIQKGVDPLQTQDASAVSLYQALIEPAASMIPAGSHVYLIPDGELSKLNFEGLPRQGPGGFKYFIEDVTLTVTGSIRMLAQKREPVQGSAAKSLLVIGNPVSTAAEYPALTHGADEIARVRQHFNSENQKVVMQTDAVPASYLANGPEGYSYVHFVAHGTASQLQPLESAIVLSPGPEGPESFKLYARDIVQQRIKADLVTISACYGSGTRAYAGEGLVGLAWAFLRAGAHNVVSALWEVNDDSTPLLMDKFYAELAAGKAPDDALRNAKLSLIHSTGVYRKPFYWATFQLYAGS